MSLNPNRPKAYKGPSRKGREEAKKWVGQPAFKFAESDTKRCNQCWDVLPVGRFVGKSGKITQDCDACRSRYRKGVADHRVGLRCEGDTRVTFVLESKNRKTGFIPASITSSETCPPSCPFFNSGCYGEASLLRHHWRRTAATGLNWKQFCQHISDLPPGTIWRHNEVGDLPGVGEETDFVRLMQLVAANFGKRGFTYTHKRGFELLSAVKTACLYGFAINVSADNLRQADDFFDEGVPVVVVISSTVQTRNFETPRGRRVVVCPATYSEITCQQCKLCAVVHRKSIVGFPAHGGRKNLVSKIVRTT